jgi:hypothetical protein
MSTREGQPPATGAPAEPDVVLRFTAALRCERRAGPLGLVLIGPTAGGQWARLAVGVSAPADLPDRLEAATVYRLGPDRYRLDAGSKQWLLGATALFLHLDVARTFFRAVPPRRASWGRRLLWHALVLLAASAPGRRWLERRSAR